MTMHKRFLFSTTAAYLISMGESPLICFAEPAGGGEGGGGGTGGDGGQGTGAGTGTGGDGGQQQQQQEQDFSKDGAEWRKTITDPKLAKEANRYASPADMVKALAETKSALGGRIKVPGKDAKPEELAAFRKALAPIMGEVPEKPEGYKFVRPEHIPEAAYNDPAVQGRIKTVAADLHAAGFSQGQVDTMMGVYWKLEREAQEAIQRDDEKAVADAEAQLRKEWGGDYEGNIKIGVALLERLGMSELADVELKSGRTLGQQPQFMKMLAELGRRTEEGSMQYGLDGTAQGAELQKQIDSLTEKMHAAHNAGRSDEARRYESERRALMSQLHGADAA